ncbi:efflux RND transporter periplasmic adaptor subunit [Methylomonas sp. AM2-LC]|uniref:efflux RND transporter periplasmic adaptor subunit n=1 Tax=Methylomonas sp. AM2-LC TaxID=3153301 RepID=UPI00326770AE
MKLFINLFKNGSTSYLLALMVLTSGCNNGTANQSATPPPADVAISQPLQKEIVEWDEYTGRLQAVESVEIRSRVSGYLKQISFKDGGKVHKGDLLFVIDPRPYQAQLHQAKSEVERSKSRRDLAKNDLQRAENLLKEQAISEEEFDTRSKNLFQAGSSIESANAAVELAELNVDFTQIRAPISGRISRKLITEGNLVSADTTLLATLVSIDPIYVYVDMDERSVLKYRRQEIDGKRQSSNALRVPLEMALIDEKGFPHKGYIDYVDPQVNPETGAIRTRGVFGNPDDLLGPGLFARVRAPGSEVHNAILINDRAIAMDQGKKYVMVVSEDHHAQYRPIETGRLYDGLRIVTDGLSPKDWIVTNGLQYVQPGATVNPHQEPMAADKSGAGS